MRIWLMMLPALMFAPELALAQDITPSWDAVTAAQQGSIVEMNRRAERRGGGRTYRSNSPSRTCASLPRFRARFGRSDPRVRRLAALCREQGY